MNRMRNVLPRTFLGRSLLAALALVLICAGTAPAKQAVTWQLTNLQVVNAGETTESPEGLLTTGYVVEADATSVNGPFANGKFLRKVRALLPDIHCSGTEHATKNGGRANG